MCGLCLREAWRMRRWSRAVAVLCIVYLVALLLFHRQMDPSRETPITNDDYMDVQVVDLKGRDITHALPALNNSVVNVTPRVPQDLKRQLKDLEVGMTKLEREISNVKELLAKEEEEARVKAHQKEKERNSERGVRVDAYVGKNVPAWQEKPDVRFHTQREEPHRGQEGQMEHVTLPFAPPFVQGERDGNDNVQRMEQGGRPALFRGSSFLPPDHLRPGAGPLHPYGIRVYRNPDGGRGLNGRAPVIGAVGAEGGAPQPEEDYTNSSLVKIGEGVAVYAAYHDDRMTNNPFVRLIVILSAAKEKRRIQCHFQSSSLPSSVTVDALQYELCENHKKKYLGFIYSCPVPSELTGKVYNLSLSLRDSPTVRVPFPVLHVTPEEVRQGQVSTENHQFKYSYSICVSPLFGSVLPRRLIEFVELNRLLGAQQVFFYDFQISSAIQRVLRYYQDKGWVTLLPWKLPRTMDNNRIWYHGQLVTNNDCLYRTMAVSAYTAFHDIDEFIVPHAQGFKTWGDLFPPVLPNDTCGYSFKSAFYDPGVTNGHYSEDLMTVALTARPSMLSRIRTKVMVAPRRVFEVGIHHISKQFLEHWTAKPFDPTVALLHHYRECIRDFGMRCENWVKDTIIKDKYMPELKDNFQQVLRRLGL